VWYHRGRRPRPPELYAAAAAASLILGYAIMQFGRENVHVGIDAGFGRQLASGLLSTAYAPFLATFGSRLLQLDGLPAAQNLVAVFGRSPLPAGLFLLAAVALAAAWFRWGNRAVRLGLIWAGLHLAFIYASLWVQDPALVDSRHAFAALAGIALAVGGTLTQAIGERVARPGAFSPRTAWAAAAAGLLIFALVQAQGARRTAAGVEILMADLEQTEAQMKAILPQVTRDTKVFAHRFTLSAPYFAPAAAVWYAAPHLEGGDLAALQSYPRLTPDFYVFDQADGRLYDLMPEVRSHRETVLLWREPAVAAELIREGEPPLPFEAHDLAVMPGSAGESRFGIEVASPPGSTVSLTYRLDVPPGASLAFAISGVAGQTFRVRAQAADGAEAVVFEESLGGDSSEGWQEQLVTLTELGGQEVQFTLEVTGAAEPAVARWANPRLVLD
jgi:hypothetical protein